MTRLVIITNGNFFARLILDRLIRERAAQIAGIVVVTGVMKDKSRFQSFMQVWRRSGWRYFLYKANTYAFFAAAALLLRRKSFFVNQLAKRHKIPLLFAPQVNDARVVAQIRQWQPTGLISVSCPQRIGKALLKMPSDFAINIHSSLLPTYAGMAPYVWVLAEGERETGTTIHIMEEEFDAGRIVVQKRVPIHARDSALALFRRLSLAGSDGMAEAVDKLSSDNPNLAEQNQEQRSYFSLPTAQTISSLYRRGYRLGPFAEFIRAAREVN